MQFSETDQVPDAVQFIVLISFPSVKKSPSEHFIESTSPNVVDPGGEPNAYFLFIRVIFSAGSPQSTTSYNEI